MKLSNWSNYPTATGARGMVNKPVDLQEALSCGDGLIAQGAHRNYGDCAFAQRVMDMGRYDCLLAFDQQLGTLHCQAGVALGDVLSVIVPKGWTIPVLPGTRHVTVGGALASDIHGKNHHIDGCFSQHVLEFALMLADGSIINCTPDQNQDLFQATSGGMGLTGVILDVRIQLMPIQSARMRQQQLKFDQLDTLMAAFDQHQDQRYSVAWLDLSSPDEDNVRSVLLLGDHHDDHDFDYRSTRSFNIPSIWPAWLLNRHSIRLYNHMRYARAQQQEQLVDFDAFFFPLDAINNWNHLYGKRGFVQYQCVLPVGNSTEGMNELLSQVAESGQRPYLSVLKRMGPVNNNLMSFPLEGYTLSMDFKRNDAVMNLLQGLDDIVVKHSGRVYLCKDARMSRQTCESGYPNIQAFRQLREKYGLRTAFASQQSKRLGL